MEQIDRVQVKEDDIFFWEFIQVTKEKFSDIRECSVNDTFAGFSLREKNKISIFEKLSFANRAFILYWEIGQKADYILISKEKESLSSKIEEKVIAGKKVFNVADGCLIACFDNDVTEETVKAVAQEKPYYAVFRDSSMANDSVATNFEQIFVTYSPETVRKVL